MEYESKDTFSFYMGYCISKLRKRIRLSQSQLVKLTGLSRYKIQKIEAGQNILLSDIDIILSALDVPVKSYFQLINRTINLFSDKYNINQIGNVIGSDKSNLQHYMLSEIINYWQIFFDTTFQIYEWINERGVVFVFFVTFYKNDLHMDYTIYPVPHNSYFCSYEAVMFFISSINNQHNKVISNDSDDDMTFIIKSLNQNSYDTLRKIIINCIRQWNSYKK